MDFVAPFPTKKRKKQSLQYAALKRAKRIGKKGLKLGSLASTAFLVGGSAPSKRFITKGLSAGSYAAGASGAGKAWSDIRKISDNQALSPDQKKKKSQKYTVKNSLGDAENKAMEAKASQMNAQIKASQMNAQIKKNQEAKKASDFKTLMERWEYENDNANPKGGRSEYGSGWKVENVKKRNKARQQKTKMGQSPNV